VYAEQSTASMKMAIESLFRSIDAGLGSGLARVSDIDDNQIGLARFGQALYGFTDHHAMTEPGNDSARRCEVSPN
jgi:hypothetical protein